MGAGAPVLAFDCEFNREVTDGHAFFWSDAEQLTHEFDAIAADDVDEELAAFSAAGRERVRTSYQWDAVADQYAEVIERLQGTKLQRGRRRIPTRAGA
jgi:glycosyltransferase involved in cell wall biosynthesis